jgi:predicted extracellular nuclease
VLFRFALALGIILSSALVVAAPARAVSDDVVISQIYGGGGNSGATLTHDFIELFNRGSTAVPLSGWSVQYASAAGTTWQVTPLTGTLQPGQYYLVQQAQGAGGTTPLPTPDASGSTAMSANNGKVALVTNSTLLPCGADCDTHPAVRDFVGYGSANDFEGGAATSALTNTTAAFRA